MHFFPYFRTFQMLVDEIGISYFFWLLLNLPQIKPSSTNLTDVGIHYCSVPDQRVPLAPFNQRDAIWPLSIATVNSRFSDGLKTSNTKRAFEDLVNGSMPGMSSSTVLARQSTLIFGVERFSKAADVCLADFRSESEGDRYAESVVLKWFFQVGNWECLKLYSGFLPVCGQETGTVVGVGGSWKKSALTLLRLFTVMPQARLWNLLAMTSILSALDEIESSHFVKFGSSPTCSNESIKSLRSFKAISTSPPMVPLSRYQQFSSELRLSVMLLISRQNKNGPNRYPDCTPDSDSKTASPQIRRMTTKLPDERIVGKKIFFRRFQENIPPDCVECTLNPASARPVLL